MGDSDTAKHIAKKKKRDEAMATEIRGTSVFLGSEEVFCWTSMDFGQNVSVYVSNPIFSASVLTGPSPRPR